MKNLIIVISLGLISVGCATSGSNISKSKQVTQAERVLERMNQRQ